MIIAWPQTHSDPQPLVPSHTYQSRVMPVRLHRTRQAPSDLVHFVAPCTVISLRICRTVEKG